MKKRNQLIKIQNSLKLYTNFLNKYNFNYFYYYNFFLFFLNDSNFNLKQSQITYLFIKNSFKISKINEILLIQFFFFLKNFYKLSSNNILMSFLLK